MSSALKVPKYNELMFPTLQAIRELGGSGTNAEINSAVIKAKGITEEQQAILLGDGPRTVVYDRCGWARSYLKMIGALENSARGIWSVTDKGRSLTEQQVITLHSKLVKTKKSNSHNKPANKAKTFAKTPDNPRLPDGQPTTEDTWQDELLEQLLAMDPVAFERLSQQLLREAGFLNTSITQRTNDGGIDGTGTYRISLISFPVFFQCKKYRGTVPSSAIRDFRGAMDGRGDKGLFITTGTFTDSAQKESTRDGATPVDLIDGEQLCELLKQYRMGVSVQEKVIEEIHIDPEYFAEFQS